MTVDQNKKLVECLLYIKDINCDLLEDDNSEIIPGMLVSEMNELILELRIDILKQKVKEQWDLKLIENYRYVEDCAHSADEYEHAVHNVDELIKCIKDVY